MDRFQEEIKTFRNMKDFNKELSLIRGIRFVVLKVTFFFFLKK